MNRLIIHYDVPQEQVLLETFIESALATKKLVLGLNESLFSGQLEIELVVFPPEAGSLKQFVGITVRFVKGAVGLYAIVWSLIQAMDSQTVQDISTELVGATPTELLLEKIRNVKERAAVEEQLDDALLMDATEAASEIVTRLASRSFEMSPEELNKAAISEELRYQIGSARAQLFEGAIHDAKVVAIGFSEEDDFPIPRNQFPERAIKPKKPTVETDEERWYVSQDRIQISSPNFMKEDQSARGWKGTNAAGNVILFEIHDQEFWDQLARKQLKFVEDTEIQVQMATLKGGRGAKSRVVLRVLRIDDMPLGTPLDENALLAVLGAIQQDSSDQHSMFD